MSQKKHIDLALNLAFKNIGKTSPNPSVGAVIVKNDRVISTGSTGPFGSAHAEVSALKNSAEDPKGAEMYISMEPCCHLGKTSPCTEAIIKAGISKVFIPILDPNPLVSGKGVRSLKESGIEVVLMNEAAESAADLIRQFKKFILRQKPFIINKSAVTLDGRTAALSGDSKWISSEYSRYIIHKLRGLVDAVIIGKNTFITDDPLLNVRIDSYNDNVKDYFRKEAPLINGRDNYFLKSLFSTEIKEFGHPLRVLIGLPENIDTDRNIFFDDNYIIFERKKRFEKLIKIKTDLKKKIDNMEIRLIDTDSLTEEIEFMLDELGSRGIMMAMLEGGGRLAGSFFDAGQIDQFFYIIAPKLAGNGIPSLAGSGVGKISEAVKLMDLSCILLKNDLIYNGYKERYNFEIYED